MNKGIQKIIAIFILTLLIGVSTVFASGKMEVKIGDTVTMQATSSAVSETYKWVVNKGKSILSTQSSQNFSYKFSTQGEHIVNLTSTSGSDIKNTAISVLVGESYKTAVTTKQGTGTSGTAGPYLVLETLPQSDSSKQVTLYGSSGKVHFLMERSVGDILEYRVDKDIYTDSDGNGTANDDIDNSGDNSYLTGSAWSATYKKGQSKIAAQITLVDKKGQKATEQVSIVFQDQSTAGDLTAILDVSPASDATDGMVHLYKDTHKVAFYARRSAGKIVEYRIDKNIFVDSDGDGDPKNDIDNLKDISFKNGDVWTTSYKKTTNQIIAQLIIVGEGGKGSRIQKGIVFGSKPTVPAPSLSDKNVKTGIYLSSDKPVVTKGDPITFTVKGLTLGLSEYTFSWDFDGDGKVDKEVSGSSTIKHSYSKPGVTKVKVSITDKKKNKAEKELTITVKDLVPTKADFTYSVSNNKVTFTNISTASQSLSNQTLTYKWSFGDTDTANFTKQQTQTSVTSPTYAYAKLGKYIVTLTITDSDKVTDTKTSTIEIKTGASATSTTATTSTTTTTTKKSSSIITKVLKVVLYLIIIIVALILLIVGGFLIFLKVQHPDLTFEELIDELKVKILTKIGAYDEHDAKPLDKSKPGEPEVAEVVPADDTAEEISDNDAVEPIQESAQDDEGSDTTDTTDETEKPSKHDFVSAEEAPANVEGPAPSWMSDDNVIEGESVEDPIDDPVGDDTDASVDENADDDLLADDESDFEGGDFADDTEADFSNEEGAPDWLNETDDESADESADGDSDEELIGDDTDESFDDDLDDESADDEVSDDELTDDETVDDESTDDNLLDEPIDDEGLDEELTDDLGDESIEDEELSDDENMDDLPVDESDDEFIDDSGDDSVDTAPPVEPSPDSDTSVVDDTPPPVEPVGDPVGDPIEDPIGESPVDTLPPVAPEAEKTDESKPASGTSDGQGPVPDWLKGG